ncbi:hypothetical protein M3Y97_00718400 [Aphelenchoides bicaudatus]|nr:hypothetical protein M3Y97_00718400 [Aphelenchoides bicaudatus]
MKLKQAQSLHQTNPSSIKSILSLNKKPSKKEAFVSQPSIDEAASQTSSNLSKSKTTSSRSSSNHSISSILSDKKPKMKSSKSKSNDSKGSRIPKPKPVRSQSSESLTDWSDSSSSSKSLSTYFSSLQLKTCADSAFKPPAELQQDQTVIAVEQVGTCAQEAQNVQVEQSECSSSTSEALLASNSDLLNFLMNSVAAQSTLQAFGQQTANSNVKLSHGLNRTGRQMVVVESGDGQVAVQNFYNSQESLASSNNLSNSLFGVLSLMNGNNENNYNDFLNYNKMTPNATNSNNNPHAYNANQYQQPQYNFQQQNPLINQLPNYPQQNGQFPRVNQWNPNNNPSLTSVSSSSRSLYGTSRQNISSTSHLGPATQHQPPCHPVQMQQNNMQPMSFRQFPLYPNQTPVFAQQQQNMLPNNYMQPLPPTPIVNASIHNNYVQHQQVPQLNSVLPEYEPSASRVKEFLLCEWINYDRKICGKKIRNSTNEYDDPIEILANHIKEEHTDKESERGNMCSWNGCKRRKGFKANYQLDLHLRKHSGYKPFKCEVPKCGKEYSRLENLKTHVRTHNSKDRDYFKKYNGFGEQVGKKPFECNQVDKNGKICEKTFTNASDRAKHVNRTHSEDKPYKCPVILYEAPCDKAYTDPSSLRKHIKTDHGPLTWKRAQKNKQLIDEETGKSKNHKKKYNYGQIFEWTQQHWPVWFEIRRSLPIPMELNPENIREVADSYNLDRLTMEKLETLLARKQQKSEDCSFVQGVIEKIMQARDYPNQLYGIWEERGGLYSVLPIDFVLGLLYEFDSSAQHQTAAALAPQQQNMMPASNQNNNFGSGYSNASMQFDSSYQPNGQASTSRSSSGFYSNSSTPPSEYSNTYKLNNSNDNNGSGFQGGFNKMDDFSFSSSIPNYSSDLLKQFSSDVYEGYLSVDENTGLLSRVEITQAVPKIEDLTSYEPAVCNPSTDFAELSDSMPDPNGNNNGVALCQFFFNELYKEEELDDKESSETQLNKLISEFFKNLNIAHNKLSKQ